MSEVALVFRLELLEDLHTGTGVGRLGIVDDTQSRDQNGDPVVWASTVRGLLREAAEDWFASCKEAKVDISEDRERLHQLLGRTIEEESASHPGSTIVRSLRFCDEDQHQEKRELFLTWSSTARETHSRRPEEKTLRQMEFASAGLVLKGEIRLPGDHAEDVALLIRLLKRLPPLGNGKTRGWGQVKLVEELKPTPLPVPSPTVLAGRKLRLVLRNLEPLNLASTALAGNLIRSQGHIPGTRLRAALLHWLSAHEQKKVANALAPTMKVGNAYVVPKGSGAETLVVPLPLSVCAPKGGQGKPKDDKEKTSLPLLPWWVLSGEPPTVLDRPGERDLCAFPLPDEDEEDVAKDFYAEDLDFKRIKTEDYAVRAGSVWRRIRPQMGVLLRNTVSTKRRDGDRERPEHREEGLFSEQVLWEDQHFLAELLFDNDAEAARFQIAAASLLAGDVKERGWLRIGRGGRPVVIEQCVVPAMTVPAVSAADRLTLTLTSDLIARTPWLTFLTDPRADDLKELVKEANGEEASGEELTGTVVIDRDRSVSETTEVYGFNTASGLPRAAALAVKRGSVFHLEGTAEVIAAWRSALAKASERGGLGERVAEGFGRFVVDLDLHDAAYWIGEKPAEELPFTTRPVDWRENVLEEVEKFMEGRKLYDQRGKSNPTVTQWQWLRNRARAADEVQLAAVFDELEKHAKKLSGAKWDQLPKELREKVNKLTDHKQKQFFLDHLAQAVVAQMRNRRRKGEDRT